jgi:hypothetical protein
MSQEPPKDYDSLAQAAMNGMIMTNKRMKYTPADGGDASAPRYGMPEDEFAELQELCRRYVCLDVPCVWVSTTDAQPGERFIMKQIPVDMSKLMPFMGWYLLEQTLWHLRNRDAGRYSSAAGMEEK